MKKTYQILSASTVLIFLSGTVGALGITDNQDDVEHYIKDPFSLEYVSNKPNLDVTQVSYSIDGDVVTLQLTIKGVIENDASITYYAEYECSDALYQFTYSDGNLNSQASEMVNGEKNLIGTATDHTIDPANTIKVTYDVIGMGGSDGDLYGYAGEDFPGVGVNEYWIDNTEEIDNGGSGTNGGTNEGNNNGGGTSSGSDTPGFEILVFLSAISLIFVFLRRKKQRGD